jgi:phosphate transport system protein
VSTRSTFSRELQEIQAEVLVLGSMVDQSITRSIDALKNRDVAEARQIIDGDRLINEKRFEIEERCLQTIATQQPMASDLRILASVLYVISDLERMGDHSEGTAKIVIRMRDEPLVKPLVDIPIMAEKCRAMLKEALDAFFRHDAKAAIEIANRDDEVDAIYDRVQRDLLNLMLADPKVIERATYLVWVAHNLERIADRVTNICERVAFVSTGRMQEVNVSSY